MIMEITGQFKKHCQMGSTYVSSDGADGVEKDNQVVEFVIVLIAISGKVESFTYTVTAPDH